MGVDLARRFVPDPVVDRTPGQILFVGRQETIEHDWERLKEILDLPPGLGLPSDPVLAHRTDPAGGTAVRRSP